MKKTLTIPFKEEGKYEIISFLSKILTYDAQIAGSSISKIIEDHGDGSPRPFRLVILKDNSQWVVGNKGIERIIGAKYLDMQLKKLTTLNFKWTAVATKYYYKLPIDKLVNLSELNRAVMQIGRAHV